MVKTLKPVNPQIRRFHWFYSHGILTTFWMKVSAAPLERGGRGLSNTFWIVKIRYVLRKLRPPGVGGPFEPDFNGFVGFIRSVVVRYMQGWNIGVKILGNIL